MNFAIIVAAGKGKRMASEENKVFLKLLNKPMLYYTLKVFQDCNEINEIIIVAQKNDFKKINEIKLKYNFTKIKNIVEGGKERQDSVYNGLTSIKNAKSNDIIIVHNASNPLVRENEITNSNPNEVFALQTALLVDGVYPSEGRNKNDCPRTGRIGPCTLGAIREFQKKYGIKGEEGRVGNMTKQILKEKFSVKAI